MELRDQIVELFPTEDKELLYVPYYMNEDKQAVSARGTLYNHYKFVRKELRLAGIFKEDEDTNDSCQ